MIASSFSAQPSGSQKSDEHKLGGKLLPTIKSVVQKIRGLGYVTRIRQRLFLTFHCEICLNMRGGCMKASFYPTCKSLLRTVFLSQGNLLGKHIYTIVSA
jgi:hypothetical protein